MTCKTCEIATDKKLSGLFDLRCLECCARLVISAHPDKRQAGAMLAAIARFKGAPGREQILECVRQCLAKRQLAGQKPTSV
jgi:hypothetical protein